ncbi:MAG: hypothetical protein KDK26_01345 [Roseivivax sp.]|nr:hypothetical protein [Roseivivax sp.]
MGEGRDFLCEPGLRLEALEQVSGVRMQAVDSRLDRIEALMERLEKRLWVVVYGVVGVILAQAFQGVMAATP